MSETTTAFLAGTAVAGVTALLLIKGGFSLGQPAPQLVGLQPSQPALSTFTQQPPFSPTTAQLPTGNTDPWNAGNAELWRTQFELQRQTIEQLKTQLEQQRNLSEQLKTQLEQQRNDSQRVLAQLQDQQRQVENRFLFQQHQAPAGPLNNQNSMQVILLWSIGGIFLVMVVGGGIMMISMVMLSQQNGRRNQRPNYVVQPLPFPMPAPNYPQQPQHRGGGTYVLPPRIRQVDAQAYYDDEF